MVSVDQLESPTPGFVPIAQGQPAIRHYCRAMVFVDHKSDFTYVHMNEALITTETLEAKHKFERIEEQHGTRVQHYHCDNGHFADHAFVSAVHKAQQTITFCCVGAPSKWYSSNMHLGYHQEHKNNVASCSMSLAQKHDGQFVASGDETCYQL